ncbi:cellulose synthase/poly-beta-1,6-N-acetylglucosamine synthase-like glycosyltransferase [Chitinophaga skermanii]|uniref:Cellulose synthase/poly-beta-1,6-N-acetylglucosamine synthase-like glycosyltransferase n=1 Tax=Chitinophaga skermanii TaxID=331697 RepID=A0A327QSR4_9BACT|nr:glycosyltransferase family 2 protein [Chitinophaga skermanii]RAJ06945.1 cellulose synthase/poly-beta-1,6-N-acetylglucosamine synthase-like glycosyltransferase [Chitinophaga skermanii]
MTAITIIFYITLFIVFYNYVGYGVLLYILVKIKYLVKKRPVFDPAFEPTAALIIAAYNEASFIEEKIKNTLSLDYPTGKLQIIFITDGSSDGTPRIIERYSQVTLLHKPERAGKTAALNRAMETVQAEIAIFCDANTLLNKEAIRNIVKHYADVQTGGVAGEKKVIALDSENAAGTEGIYWKYESALKKWDAQLYSVVGAAGELFSIRTKLYEPVEPGIILDDFVISLRVNLKGYRVAYAPDAYAMETPSGNMREEEKRKIRISAGGFQAIGKLGALLQFWKHPLLTWQYISHRVLRWTLSPLSLPLLLVSNIILLLTSPNWFYMCVMAGQALFYVLAIAGFILSRRNIKHKAVYIPYYFLFMNIAVYQGFWRFIRKKQAVTWEKANRQTATTAA